MNRDSVKPALEAFPPVPEPEIVEEVVRAARAVLERTHREFPEWSPPPYDPETVATALGFPVTQADALGDWDALLVPDRHTGFRILTNRSVVSPGRRRFSIAHEIAHTFFEDAADAVRRRARRVPREMTPEERDLERLCDRGAAEMLMPEEPFRDDAAARGWSAAAVPALAERYAVSLEAAAVRMMQVPGSKVRAVGFYEYAQRPATRAAGEQRKSPPEIPEYRVKRVFTRPGLPFLWPEGKSVPRTSVVYRASLGSKELTAEEEFRLGSNRAHLTVSAAPVRSEDDDFPRPPLVCAVFR